MRLFIIKSLNLLAVLCILFIYQKHALVRADILTAHKEKEQVAAAIQKKYEEMTAVEQESFEFSETSAGSAVLQDGAWEGVSEGFGGEIRLQITVRDNRITKVDVISAELEDPQYLAMAEALCEQIVEKQTAEEIDTITGATFSSRGILGAAARALEEAQVEVKP